MNVYETGMITVLAIAALLLFRSCNEQWTTRHALTQGYEQRYQTGGCEWGWLKSENRP
jgi:hypothetical protein